MSRKGLLRRFLKGADDARLTRLEDNVADAIETVCADHDIPSGNAKVMVAGGQIPAGEHWIVYRGPAGQTLTMAPVAAAGKNVCRTVSVINATNNNVIVACSVGDLNNFATSTVTIPANSGALFIGDGQHLWMINS